MENQNNDEPKVVFQIKIEQFNNSTSKHTVSTNVPLEIIRNLLFAHMMLIEEQITMIKIEQRQTKLVSPNQLSAGMKLRQ